jgi:hypothetical protein
MKQVRDLFLFFLQYLRQFKRRNDRVGERECR